MKKNNNETQKAGAAPQDDYPETPTFPNRLTITPEVVDDTELADTALADAVSAANNLAANLDKLANCVLENTRQHLLQSISLGYLLDNLQQECGRKRVNFTALFSNSKDDDKRKKALAAVGGQGFSFTYQAANKKVQLFRGVRERMVQAGGMTEQEVQRMISDHAAQLAFGEDIGALWAPYLTSTSLRQAYLELAPAKPQPTLGNTLDNAVQQPSPFADWEAQRANLCTRFGGIFSNLDLYITDMSRYTKPEDRIAQAEQLEDAAKKLRSMKTQYDLPGVDPAN